MTRAPNQKEVREALFRVLRERGLEPEENWLTVVAEWMPWDSKPTYTVIVAHEPARFTLSEALPRTAGRYAVDIWVLREAEARELCA
jgi:hypothetical protein